VTEMTPRPAFHASDQSVSGIARVGPRDSATAMSATASRTAESEATGA